MFASGAMISNDILDIGTHRYDENKRRSMTSTGGTAALCPPSLVLGDPAAFDIPNVPDVSNNLHGVVVIPIWMGLSTLKYDDEYVIL